LKKWTYGEAGVDVFRVKQVHRTAIDFFAQTLAFRKGFGSVFKGAGHYAGLLRIDAKKLLAIHTDGVGTKVLVAQKMRKFSTVGIDCVAMNVNDVVCVGAEPFALVDYIALKSANENLVAEISNGLAEGAKLAKVAIVGGETAILPDILVGDENAFDLAATCVGFVEEQKLILGKKIREGDSIIGVESSGIHSNGLTLARKVLQKHLLNERIPNTKLRIGDELLKSTRIYCKEIIALIEEGFKITGLAHITGGAFTKLQGISPSNSIGFSLENMPKPQEIFSFIQKEGRIAKEEMYRTFNMGIGFCIIAPKAEANNIVKSLHAKKLQYSIIGRAVGKPEVFLYKQQLS